MGLDAGSTLVLESNGTTVDEDVLVHVRNEILILLVNGQTWIPREHLALSQSSGSMAVSLPSNDTLHIDNPDEYTDQFLNLDVEEAAGSEKFEAVNTNVLNEIQISQVFDCNSENFWFELDVPFNKMNQKELDEMSKGIRNGRTRKKLVHMVVDEMRFYKETIPSKAFRYMAKKIVDKYPATFKDIDEDGVVLGDGTYSLVMKMQEHNNYLNRPHKRKTPVGVNPITNKKRLVAARSGCVDFSPAPSSSENSVEELKMLSRQTENIEDIVERTYSEVRNFLNKNPFPSVMEIKEEWPIVFSKKGIFLHFNKLTKSSIELLSRMTEKEEKIKKCSKSTSDEGGEIGLVKMIMSHFKEKFEALVVDVKNLSDPSNFESFESIIPATPCIVRADYTPTLTPEEPHCSHEKNSSVDAALPSSQHFVFIDKICVDDEGYDSFIYAFKILFALFFILNIKYPENAECSLEFIQRYFLKIHPDQGSKTRKVSLSRKKVFTFMNKLSM